MLSRLRIKEWAVWFFPLLLWVVYALTAPANHAEAEDVYDYALRVEQGTFAEQVGVNRLLALPFYGVAYDFAQEVGFRGRAFGFIIGLNRLLAVAAIFLFSCMVSSDPQGARRDRGGAIVCALLLAFSYGFWRYANEAEVYVLAMVLLLGAWAFVLMDRGRVGFWAGVVFSALGILSHLLNAIPLLLVVPLYYLLSKSWKKAMVHGVVVAMLVVAGYGVVWPFLDLQELGAQHHFGEAGFGISNLVRGGLAFGQSLLGANFVFGFEPVRAALQELFPSRMLEEEFFMARQMGGWIPWAALCSLLLVVIAFVKTMFSKGVLKSNVLWVVSLVWLLLYACAILRTEAGSAELWIPALVPFWICVIRWLKPRGAWMVVLGLFVHNLIGGLMPVMSQKTDYHREKGRWLVANGTANDLVLTSYEPILIFYLNYFTPASVVNSGSMELGEIEKAIENSSGKVYALDTFFTPLSSMRERMPRLYDKMEFTGGALSERFVQIETNEFGGVYLLKQLGE